MKSFPEEQGIWEEYGNMLHDRNVFSHLFFHGSPHCPEGTFHLPFRLEDVSRKVWAQRVHGGGGHHVNPSGNGIQRSGNAAGVTGRIVGNHITALVPECPGNGNLVHPVRACPVHSVSNLFRVMPFAVMEPRRPFFKRAFTSSFSGNAAPPEPTMFIQAKTEGRGPRILRVHGVVTVPAARFSPWFR